MDPIYSLCPCGSGTKFKFCCLKKNPEELLKDAAKYPLHECCLANNGWRQHGMAVLFVSRKVIESRYICAFYMVDTYCLGLKDTFAQVNLDRSRMLELRSHVEHTGALQPYNYEDARSLILGAIDFAASFGFKPNEDWNLSGKVIEETRAYVPRFKFGKDGKPFYVQGPHDDARSIMNTLSKFDHNYLVRA